MMNRDKMSELPTMQIGFIDSICAPIYTAFARLFPQQLHTLIDGCLANRNLWREMAESNKKPDISAINYLACDNDGPSGNQRATKTLPTIVSASKSEISLPRQLLELDPDNDKMRPYSELAEEERDATGVEADHLHTSATASKLMISAIDNKLAETGLTASQIVPNRQDGQRRSI
jgi:hypothetical protein